MGLPGLQLLGQGLPEAADSGEQEKDGEKTSPHTSVWGRTQNLLLRRCSVLHTALCQGKWPAFYLIPSGVFLHELWSHFLLHPALPVTLCSAQPGAKYEEQGLAPEDHPAPRPLLFSGSTGHSALDLLPDNGGFQQSH